MPRSRDVSEAKAVAMVLVGFPGARIVRGRRARPEDEATQLEQAQLPLTAPSEGGGEE